MIGNVIAPFEGVYIEPFDPDSVFDPTTHVATEENFMKLLEHGVYDSKYIGYKVQLGNSVDYNNGIWVIADVNHDSANTGQTNCYDLVSLDCFHSAAYSSYSQSWRSSTARTWLNNTFYPGFSSEFKNHILTPKYNSQGTWYADDYVILPSCKEVNGRTTTAAEDEGAVYPIFTNNASRIKNQFGGGTYYWWTRSRYVSNSNYVWCVLTDGSMSTYTYNNSGHFLAPLLRIS